jgi:hypothetical protein
MIDKRTINKESFLLLLPKKGVSKLKRAEKERKRLRDRMYASWERSHFWWTAFAIMLAAGISAFFVSGLDLDVDAFIEALLFMPHFVMVWVQKVNLEAFINKIYLPTLVLVLFIFVVVKLTKPDKD